MKRLLLYCAVIALCLAGCINEPEKKTIVNQPPITFFWIFPDTTVHEGNSSQHVHWWGQDQDGIVIGYLFASGKFLTPAKMLPHPDTISWKWTTAQDTNLSFPLLVKRDTFSIAVLAVDNQFKQHLPDTGLVQIKLTPFPYWDVNRNGQFDSSDVALPSLAAAVDPKGAVQAVPVLNQPPSVVFAQDPNNPSVTMQQPETTFTVATFSWVGTDPDGDQTIAHYEVALNDTSTPARWFSVSGKVNLVTLIVPRSRTDQRLPGDTSAVAADVYGGTFKDNALSGSWAKATDPTRALGSVQGLRLNSYNRFFLRARDIAGDVSPVIFLPDTGKHWYVKSPQGKLLIISDFIGNSEWPTSSVISFYRDMFSNKIGGQFSNFEVLDIARGLSTGDKNNSKIGPMVPPFMDPAMVLSLHLFDVVLWFTDAFPSLAVAQSPLYEYTHDVYHTGRVIYSTMFQTNIDPRGALKDFAPIDSVSSVDLISAGRLFPTLGDTRIPGGYWLYADSSEPGDIFPTLQFNVNVYAHSLYMRPIYKRADSRYIYHMQNDVPRSTPTIPLVRYSYLMTLNEIRSVSSLGSQSWVSGAMGLIAHTSNSGQSWDFQSSGTPRTLKSIQFMDGNNGWCLGDSGTILRTNNAGATWNDVSLVTVENFSSVYFTSSTHGVIVGTNGLIIRTDDGGATWTSSTGVTNQNLNCVRFAGELHGVAVGDSGTVVGTNDGGITWQRLPAGRKSNLNSVCMPDSQNVYIVGVNDITNVLKSTNGGQSWQRLPAAGNAELRSVFFVDKNTGWVCGVGGTIYATSNGGASWLPSSSGVSQNLNALVFTGPNEGLVVGGSMLTRADLSQFPGGGVVLRTNDAGSTWQSVPSGGTNVGVIDGDKHFVFLGLPLHLLNGSGSAVRQFLQFVLFNEFGFNP